MSDAHTFDLPPWDQAALDPEMVRRPTPSTASADAVDDASSTGHRPLVLVGAGSSTDSDLERAAVDATRRAIDDLSVQMNARGLGDLSDVRVSLVQRDNAIAAVAIGRALPR